MRSSSIPGRFGSTARRHNPPAVADVSLNLGIPGYYSASDLTIAFGEAITTSGALVGLTIPDVLIVGDGTADLEGFEYNPTNGNYLQLSRSELTAAVETNPVAFTLSAAHGDVTIGGPDVSGTRLRDPREPYNWLGEFAEDAAVQAWLLAYQGGAVSLTIRDGLAAVDGDAQPAALAFTVPAATGEARRTEGDAQPAALAFTVPAATGEARRTEGDAQPAAFAFEAAAATGHVSTIREGDAQPAALAFTVPAATGHVSTIREGDAQPAALAFTVPAATGHVSTIREGDA